MHVIALGYVGVEARDSRRWIAFAEEVLGLRATETEDGLVLLRMDERAYRIAVHPGNRDGLAYLGWELPNVPALERAADELTQQGVTFERGTEDECARRQVRGLLRFVDPAGSPLELFCGQRFNSTPFLPTRPVSGFLTGPLGMGHVVIRTPEAQATADFYTNVLGFRISDYFADRLIFLHCNGRHHSVAFGNLGPGRGLSHIMHGAWASQQRPDVFLLHAIAFRISDRVRLRRPDRRRRDVDRDPAGPPEHLGAPATRAAGAGAGLKPRRSSRFGPPIACRLEDHI